MVQLGTDDMNAMMTGITYTGNRMNAKLRPWQNDERCIIDSKNNEGIKGLKTSSGPNPQHSLPHKYVCLQIRAVGE